MTPTNSSDRLQARRTRNLFLRKRVVALAVALFLTVWALLLVQLISGHDPALGKQSSSSSASSGSGSASSSSGGAAANSGSTGGTNSSAGSSNPVTTSQS